jgi:hypothetical protein
MARNKRPDQRADGHRVHHGDFREVHDEPRSGHGYNGVVEYRRR